MTTRTQALVAYRNYERYWHDYQLARRQLRAANLRKHDSPESWRRARAEKQAAARALDLAAQRYRQLDPELRFLKEF